MRAPLAATLTVALTVGALVTMSPPERTEQGMPRASIPGCTWQATGKHWTTVPCLYSGQDLTLTITRQPAA